MNCNFTRCKKELKPTIQDTLQKVGTITFWISDRKLVLNFVLCHYLEKKDLTIAAFLDLSVKNSLCSSQTKQNDGWMNELGWTLFTPDFSGSAQAGIAFCNVGTKNVFVGPGGFRPVFFNQCV